MRHKEATVETVYHRNEHVRYECYDGVVYVITENNHWSQRMLRRIGIRIPEKTTIKLDKYGSIIFPAINGENTVKQIGDLLISKIEEAKIDQYERLLSYLNYLATEKKWITVI